MEAPHRVIIIKFLVCCWSVLVAGSFSLLLYKHIHDTLLLPFTIAAVGLPWLVMESLFHGSRTIVITMIFVVALGLVELAFLLYNLIRSISSREDFLPIQSNLWPFALAIAFSLARMVLSSTITVCLAKIREVDFEKRFMIKEKGV